MNDLSPSLRDAFLLVVGALTLFATLLLSIVPGND